MGKLIYRMCLAVVLVAAVAGGIYYYRMISGQKQGSGQGIFVDRRVDIIQTAPVHVCRCFGRSERV